MKKQKKFFEKYDNVIGKNLNDCHNEKSKKIIKEMFEKKFINAYTILKKGVKKLMSQLPYYDDNNKFSGYIEKCRLKYHIICHILRGIDE